MATVITGCGVLVISANKNPLAAPPKNKRRKARRKKVRGKMYFTKNTEKAIVLYNETEDFRERQKIYNEQIKYPFEKLAENILNTFKFSYFEVGNLDVQKDVVSFLVSNMHKYQKEKGKAFSYFSVVAKNFLILNNNTNFRRFKQHKDIETTNPIEEGLVVNPMGYRLNRELREFFRLMIDYWEENAEKLFKKSRDIKIVYALVELFRKCEVIENFNKKALYLYVREMTDCKTQHITKVINRMKKVQAGLHAEYIRTGTIMNNVPA